MTENQIVVKLTKFLLHAHFHNKRNMASSLEIPYRTLLNVCSGKGSKQGIIRVARGILRYCIVHQIYLDQLENLFS